MKASTIVENDSVSMQLPARYQVSICDGCSFTKRAIRLAPRGPIILLPSKKCFTKEFVSRLSSKPSICVGPTTILHKSMRWSS